ncbi:MAG TPA: FapA family protein, partial [Bacteroidota bacterium]|nr:FapA family protein [Bacteroidota bacterium]
NLGLGEEANARVRVGKRALTLERINAREREAAHVRKQLEEVQEAVYKVIRSGLDAHTSAAEQQDRTVKLQAVQAQLQQALKENEQEREALRHELRETKDARIVVRDTLHANVFVELNGVKKLISGSLREVVLTENGGKIEERALE